MADLPYDSAAVVPAATPLLFTAGVCPLDADGLVVAPGDVARQTTVVVESLRAVLAEHGADVSHVVRTTIYVVGDRTALVSAWRTYEALLAPARPPSTLLGVSVLGHPGQLVEIDAVAALP